MEEAWEDLRGEIMAAWQKPGKRPWAWWLFDSPAPRDSDISQATQLKNLGILKGDELARTPAHDLGPDWWKPVLEYD